MMHLTKTVKGQSKYWYIFGPEFIIHVVRSVNASHFDKNIVIF